MTPEFMPGERVSLRKWNENLNKSSRKFVCSAGEVISYADYRRLSNLTNLPEGATAGLVCVLHDEPTASLFTMSGHPRTHSWSPNWLELEAGSPEPAGKHKCRCPREVWLLQGCQCKGI